MKVQEYIREDGSNPYQKWFDGLDAIAAAKVTVAKSRLELGNIKSIKNGRKRLDKHLSKKNLMKIKKKQK